MLIAGTLVVQFVVADIQAVFAANDNDLDSPLVVVTDTGYADSHYNALAGIEIPRIPHRGGFVLTVKE